MNDPTIDVKGISKRFGAVRALDECYLAIPDKGVVTLLGPSGSGKTTLLRVIAGFERPDTGTIDVNGQMVVGESVFLPPERRAVGVVFQDYALFPHMDVAANVGYGLGREWDRASRVGEILELVGLARLHGRFPHELSGGQQQRVALARALAPRPAVILLDEPFSNLDAGLRSRVRSDVLGIVREAAITAIFITHDQDEALSMSDLVAVMDRGRIVQLATPHELYQRPVNEWVGSFLGDANFTSGRAMAGLVRTKLGVFPTELEGEVRVMIRPESLKLTSGAAGSAVVMGCEFFGHDQLITVLLADGTLVRARTDAGERWASGDPVEVLADEMTGFAVYGPDAPRSLTQAKLHQPA